MIRVNTGPYESHSLTLLSTPVSQITDLLAPRIKAFLHYSHPFQENSLPNKQTKTINQCVVGIHVREIIEHFPIEGDTGPGFYMGFQVCNFLLKV